MKLLNVKAKLVISMPGRIYSMKSRAYGSVTSLAPKATSISSMKRAKQLRYTTIINISVTRALPRVRDAPS